MEEVRTPGIIPGPGPGFIIPYIPSPEFVESENITNLLIH